MRACTRSLAALWRPSYWETHHTICPPQHHMSDTTPYVHHMSCDLYNQSSTGDSQHHMSTVCPPYVLYIPWLHSISSSFPTITRKHEILLMQSYDFTVSQPVYHHQIFTVSPPVSILIQCFPLVFPWGRTGETLGTVSTTASAAVLLRTCLPSPQWSPRGLPPPRGWLWG